MEIFHYISNELKDVPLFSTDMPEDSSRTGAVYNDFDNETPFPSDEDEISYSFSLSPPVCGTTRPTVAQEEIDHAILAEMDEPGNVTFDLDDFDCESETPDKEYRGKVYKIISSLSDNINISEECLQIYEIRERNQWSLADTVYDCWLLGRGTPRDWFPIEVFEAEYPDFQDIIDSKADKDHTSDEDEDEENNEDGRETTNKLSISTALELKRKGRGEDEESSDEPVRKRRHIEYTTEEEPSGTDSENKRFEVKEEVSETIYIIDDSDEEREEVEQQLVDQEFTPVINSAQEKKRFEIKEEIEEVICISDDTDTD